MREHMVNGYRQRSLPALALNRLCEILPTAYDFAPNDGPLDVILDETDDTAHVAERQRSSDRRSERIRW